MKSHERVIRNLKRKLKDVNEVLDAPFKERGLMIIHQKQRLTKTLLDRAEKDYPRDGSQWAILVGHPLAREYVRLGVTLHSAPGIENALVFHSKRGARFAARAMYFGTGVKWDVLIAGLPLKKGA